MCLAIAAKPGAAIPASSMRGGAASNRDGGGYAFLKDGAVVIKKGFFDVGKLIEEYLQDFENNKESAFIMHFRTATHGGVSSQLTHPFTAGKAGAFVHNGVVSSLGSRDKSDTAEFAELLEDVSVTELPDVVAALDKHMARTFNKMAFLSVDNSLHFINELDGQWEGDVWYSNSAWKYGLTDRGGVVVGASCPLPNPTVSAKD